jgi:hypothetical protein
MRIIGNNPAADNAEITAVASGTLPDGKAVIVNANGTVSVAAESSVSQSATTPALLIATYSPAQPPNIVYDSNSDRIVFTYSDAQNGTKATAIVGNVGSSSISFGSPVVYNSSSVILGQGTVFDSSSNKIISAYSQSGGKANVGTVNPSNNSISFGSTATFDSSNVNWVSAVYDSGANKVVVSYEDTGNSNYGTSVVGTVSGTTISFGTPVVFNSNNSDFVTSVYDPDTGKVVIMYEDRNGNRFESVVGTVSGTGISFGTTVLVRANYYSYFTSVYDTSANKVVVAAKNGVTNSTDFFIGTVSGTDVSFTSAIPYTGTGNTSDFKLSFDSYANKVVLAFAGQGSLKAYVVTGIVSGNSISFDTALTLTNNYAGKLTPGFDSTAQKSVIAYVDLSVGDDFNYVLFTSSATVTTLTAENFIGFANGAASDTGTARVQIGSGINGAQSSLTAGQQYFVQTDGTLGLTADDPSVIAGTAISATEIIVKG